MIKSKVLSETIFRHTQVSVSGKCSYWTVMAAQLSCWESAAISLGQYSFCNEIPASGVWGLGWICKAEMFLLTYSFQLYNKIELFYDTKEMNSALVN